MKHTLCSGSLILEKTASLAAAWLHRYRIPFFSSVFFGLLAYGYAFTNKLVNHDEVNSLFSKGATVSSGRWGLSVLDTIFPNYSMPWIYGLLTVFFVAVAVCLVVQMFRLNNRVLQVLLSGTIMVFPSLIGLFGYMFTSTSFALSFLLAVAAAVLIKDLQKWYMLPALCCLVFSLGIYQSYISVTASLLVILLIQQLLMDENPLIVLRKGIFYVCFLIVSLCLYYLGVQVVLWITGTALNSYASSNLDFSVASFMNGVILAYRNFIRYFADGFRGLIPTAFSRILHIFLLVMSLILLLLLMFRSRKKSPGQIALLLLLTGILPLAINCMFMITTPDSIHTLVLYSFIAVYIFASVLTDLILSESHLCSFSGICVNAITILLVLVICINTYLANQSYLHLHLRYENAYAFYTSLAADIKMTPGFDENTRLAIIGEYQQPDYYYEQFWEIHTITGVYGFLPDSYSISHFLEYYIGFPIPIVSEKDCTMIQNTPEFQAMAQYPYYGSLQKMGDILVVKLS